LVISALFVSGFHFKHNDKDVILKHVTVLSFYCILAPPNRNMAPYSAYWVC